MLANIILQSFHAVIADDKPQLKGTESTAQWNTPVLKKLFFNQKMCQILSNSIYPVIYSFVRMAML